jgi:hypothetical protein
MCPCICIFKTFLGKSGFSMKLLERGCAQYLQSVNSFVFRKLNFFTCIVSEQRWRNLREAKFRYSNVSSVISKGTLKPWLQLSVVFDLHHRLSWTLVLSTLNCMVQILIRIDESFNIIRYARSNIQPTLTNFHAAFGLVWPEHESWEHFHANSRLPTAIHSCTLACLTVGIRKSML